MLLEEFQTYSETNLEGNDEFNKSKFYNEELYDFQIEQNNQDFLKQKTASQKPNRALQTKLIYGFVFLCVAVVMCTGIYLPVFSEIVTPIFSVGEVALASNFTFSSVSSTNSKISAVLKIKNVDLSANDCYLCLVQTSDATNEYLLSVPDAVKAKQQRKILSNTFACSFSEYMGLAGGIALSKNTNYCLIVVKNNIIIKSQFAKTKSMSYISNVSTQIDTDATKKYLKIQVTSDVAFQDFNSIYFEVFDISENKVCQDYAIINKSDLTTSWASIPANITDPIKSYQLRLYCSTNSPEDIDYSSSFVKDGITYYLFYIYENLISF